MPRSAVKPDTITGLLKPTGCAVSRFHRPVATRFVLHHICPQVCGGQTTTENTVGLCDSCHYTVHMLLYALARGVPPRAKGTRAQRKLAQQGYDACVLAGTVHKIPNEG